MLDHTSGRNNRFLLVYGSATGQAKAIAEEIAEKALSFGLLAELHSLEETGKMFNIEKEKCVVVLTSSTGDGDPPPNAEKFMRRIRKRTLSRDYLAHLHYALLGLGDSNYSNFCRCPRDLDNRLEELGAHRFYPTGLADDGVGLEIVVDPWLEGLYPALKKFLGVTGANNATLTEVVPAKSLSESDNCRILVNVVQDTSNDISLKNALVNGDTGLTKTSSSENSARNIEHENESANESSHTKTVVSSDSENNTKNINSFVGDGNDSTCISECPPNLTLSSETSQEDRCLIDSHSLHTNTDTAQETNTNITGIQTKDTTTSTEATECLDSVAKHKWLETQCVPVSISDPLSSLLLLTTSQPPLSEQKLTVPVLPPPFLSAKFGGNPVQISTLSYQNGCKLPCAASEVLKVQILSAHVLTAADAVKKTLLLRLDLKDHNITYSPGDSISILCPNNTSEVDLLLRRLGQNARAHDTLTLSVLPDTTKRRAAIPSHVHPVSTLQHILTTCLNIREPPNKAFIRALIEHTYDDHEVRRMQELCSKEGAQEYTNCIREPNVSLLDFLYAFPSCKPSLETVIEHLPRLQPRPYSICSCPENIPTGLDLVFNVVEIPSDKTKGHLYQRRGICSGWLDDITSHLQSGMNEVTVEIPIFLRTNQHFRPPDDISKPLIMIGPGTGVAPFIGFLQQRALRKSQLVNKEEYGATWLFYGCRKKDKDYLFREELHQLETEGTITNLCVAYSRDQPEKIISEDVVSQPPRYVQDLLRLAAQNISNLLTESEAFVYVCGDAKNMAKDVSATFEDILQSVKGLSPDDAHMFMMKKRIHKTYFEDIWV